jgi:hypothetical protein
MRRVISYLLGNGAAQDPGTWGSGFAVGIVFGMRLHFQLDVVPICGV